MAGFYAALRRQNDAAPLADFATALHTRARRAAAVRPSRSPSVSNRIFPLDLVDESAADRPSASKISAFYQRGISPQSSGRIFAPFRAPANKKPVVNPGVVSAYS